MLTYENASSDGDVTVFCTQRGNSHGDKLFIHTCVFARLWVLCICCVCDGHVGLSGAAVTLTQSLSVTADLDTHWHSGRGKVKLLSPGGLVLDALWAGHTVEESLY